MVSWRWIIAITRVPRIRWRALRARARRADSAHCWMTGTTKRPKRRTVKRLPRSIAARIGMAAARLRSMEGLLDWYWLGVAIGLGVAAGAAFLRGPTVAALASLAALVGAAV